MSLAYKPSGPIPGYKPMGFYVGWAYMRGNRVQSKGENKLNQILVFFFCFAWVQQSLKENLFASLSVNLSMVIFD